MTFILCVQWKVPVIKDGLLFLVDCSKSMFEPGEDGTCQFQLAIRVCTRCICVSMSLTLSLWYVLMCVL